MDNHHLLELARCWAWRSTMTKIDHEAKLIECTRVEVCFCPDLDLVQRLESVVHYDTVSTEGRHVATFTAAIYC